MIFWPIFGRLFNQSTPYEDSGLYQQRAGHNGKNQF